MAIQDCPYPEMYLIGYIEATVKSHAMTPRQKVRAIEKKIREYNEDQVRRRPVNVLHLPQPTAEKQ